MKAGLLSLLAAASAAGAEVPPVPRDITRQLPPGYEVLASMPLADRATGRSFQIVALGRGGESGEGHRVRNAAPRPLLIFERRAAGYVAAGRNDHVVLRANEGGQCDPFLDTGASIAVKGRFFTVENGVACGQHWSDFVTFRFDGNGFVFDNERSESWSLNPSNAPDAEALVRDSPQQVVRDRPGRVTPFSAWRREQQG